MTAPTLARDDIETVLLDGQLVDMPHWMAEVMRGTSSTLMVKGQLHPGVKIVDGRARVEVAVDGKRVKDVPLVTATPDPKGELIPRLTTIYDAAQTGDITIPILCHREYMKPVAVCRVCSVKVTKNKEGKSEWKMTPACQRPIEPGMEVETQTAEVKKYVKVLAELLLSDHPVPCDKHKATGECELETLARDLGIERKGRFPQGRRTGVKDMSSLVIAVDHSSCILCDRCVRGCNDIRNNHVIGRRGKGYNAGISFDLDAPMGSSSCVACGECMVSCPTGALTHRELVEAEPWKDVVAEYHELTADELVKHELFAGVSEEFLRVNEGSVIRRQYRKGQIVCLQGDYGSTAFYIEKGSVEVYIDTPMAHIKSKKAAAKGPFGLVRRFASTLAGRSARLEDEDREDEVCTNYIHIDAPVALSYDDPVATLGAKELFGEMACMNHYPRSATVRAKEDSTILQILRNTLYILQRNKKTREMLEERYRAHTIDNHLRSVDIFAPIAAEPRVFEAFLSYMRPRVKLIRLNPGDVIVKQGEKADALYLVRIGFVKVSETRPGGEHVLAYIGPGKIFGEVGLVSHFPELEGLAPPGERIATCTALDHVDVVRIEERHFHKILDKFPDVRARVIEIARERLEENANARKQVDNVRLNEFLDQGLMNAQSLLVLDLERCTRCDECTKACADTHLDPTAKGGVTRLIREGMRFDRFLVASSCRCCLDPYCMVGCPVGSIRRRKTREIIIENWCIGCGKCAENCPYGNINMHPFDEGQEVSDPDNPERILKVLRQKATTCDLCIDMKDGKPSCVYACPHDAAFRVVGKDLLEHVSNPSTPLKSSTPERGKKLLRPQG